MSRPILILGMHRSGTSVVAQLVSALGVYAGEPEELFPADEFNPTGYWEHRQVVRLDDEILHALGATWTGVGVDVARLSDAARASFTARARSIASALGRRGPFLLKDPRMPLLFPLWRSALEDPVCVVVWREPMAVARSLATRDKRPLLASLAAWEHATRALFRASEGLPRMLVSYEELLAEPVRVASEMRAALSDRGVAGLSMPADERIARIVRPELNRSGHASEVDLLDHDQRALVDDLRSGAVLRIETRPASRRTLQLLEEFDALERQRNDRDRLLAAIAESRSWRIGHWLTGLARALRRSEAVSAIDRWRELGR